MLDNTQIMKGKIYGEKLISKAESPKKDLYDFELVMIITPTKNYFVVRREMSGGHGDRIFKTIEKAESYLKEISQMKEKKQ